MFPSAHYLKAQIFIGRINDIRLIACVTLIAILALAIVGMDWVTRVQMGLLVSPGTWLYKVPKQYPRTSTLENKKEIKEWRY